MIEYLVELDNQFLLWVNGFNNMAADPIVYLFSSRFVWIPMYVSIAIILIDYFGWRKGLLLIAAIGLAVGCADLICARAIRPFVERLRPANLDNPISEYVHVVFDYRGGKYGFPSCHAANSMALAMSSALIVKRRAYGIFIFLWAIAQCYSRMYLGVHYFGDLLVGTVIGILCGFIFYLLSNLAIAKCRLTVAPAHRIIRQWIPIAIGLLTIAIIVLVNFAVQFSKI